ncbi:hypothetical protein H5410_036094 [Solanum commersonii]|uniref:Uncharacterized protein n=1 Tax=Solanum commersonii TaxID=4109 RepID=A0A9J5Y748_SOLCO|nr:hypothetical protein H5410_036094 [Solanum commersonii]
MREGDIEENNSRALATPSTQFRCISEDVIHHSLNLKYFVGSSRQLAFRFWRHADPRLLAIPTSCSRVAKNNPN